MVLVAGEAGAGKTALARAFADTAGVRVLWGGCDALFTPRPLGPIADVAADVGGELERLVEAAARPHDLLPALLAELRRPSVLVLEDLHWADEATLDLVRLLGRRLGGSPSLVLGTYRDDELGATHPLRPLLAALTGARGVRRLTLATLSAHRRARARLRPRRRTRTSSTAAPAGTRSTSRRCWRRRPSTCP